MQILRQMNLDRQYGEFVFQLNFIVGFVGVPSNVCRKRNFDSVRFLVAFLDKVLFDWHREDSKHEFVYCDSKTSTCTFDCLEAELGGKTNHFVTREMAFSIMERITINSANKLLLYDSRQI